MLNVGPLELLVVLAVALIVVGPERLPDLARAIGRVLRQLRDVQDEVRTMVSSGVDDDMRQAAAEFKKTTGDIVRAAGVGDLQRRSGRRPATVRKATPPATAAPTVGTEGAGPPADRLLGDGSGASASPTEPAANDVPKERPPERPSEPSGQPPSEP